MSSLAAIQWLPTLDALGTSTRSASDSSFADTGALHPLNLVQLVAPYLFGTRVAGQNTHELGLYAGAVPLLLSVWLLAQRRCWGRYAPLVWAALACGGIALILAFGQTGGLYRLQTYLPLVGHFRFPCRAIVLVQFSIAVIAAAAVAVLQNRPDEADPAETRRADRWLVLAFAASLGLAVVGPLVWPQFVARPLLVWCGPVLVGMAALLIALGERRVRGALVALALFTAVDLSCYGLSYSVWQHTADLNQFVADAPLPPAGAPVRVAAQDTGGLRTGNRMLLAGVSRVDGYAGLEPSKRLDYRTAGALRLAGAQFTLTAPSADKTAVRTWKHVPQPAPRARLVSRTVPFERLAEAAATDSDVAALDEPLELPASAAGTAQLRPIGQGALPSHAMCPLGNCS